MITLNMSLCLCQCVRVTECAKDPLLDVTVRYILLSGDQGAFAKVRTLMYNKHSDCHSQPATGCVS